MGALARPLNNQTTRSVQGPSVSETDLRANLEALHPRAYAWALRCCRDNPDGAADVLHSAYTKVLDGSARFGGKSQFGTWLFGVIYRTAREQRRRDWLRLLRLERWWEQGGDGGPGGDIDEGDDRVAALRRALTLLARRQREVLHLVFYENLTIQEAADVLKMPVGTARTHYERGKARLRTFLTQQTLHERI